MSTEALLPATGNARRNAVLAAWLLVALSLALLWQTAASMAAIWWRSETFMHGFLIAPISLWLIWQKRRELAGVPVAPAPLALPLLAGAGFVWLLASFTDVQVVQQLALVALMPLIVWAVLGWRMAWALAFPLGFLFFAVPMGEALIPPMMDFTADFTVRMLQLTGIPVFKEGTFFEIPSGRWSVVEGCSGLRYLIASITLGFLYAYLTYRSLPRRLLFIAAAVVVPIIANGLRAYMIVMIAHLSDMKLALGVDHFIYGWVFFGLVMLLLFWVGSFWRQDDAPLRSAAQAASAVPAGGRRRAAAVALAVALLIGIWPAFAALRAHQAQAAAAVQLSAPQGRGGWSAQAAPLSDWAPRYLGADAELDQGYAAGEGAVALHLRYYRYQRQDAELVNSQNVMVVQKHPVWRQVRSGQAALQVAGRTLEVRSAVLRSAEQNLLVYHWYWIGGQHEVNPYRAKLIEAWHALLGGRRDAAGIVIAAPFAVESAPAEEALQAFLDQMLPAIEAGLARNAQN